MYYHAGVGTEGSWLSRVAGGATAAGLAGNIREAYGFIALNYVPGDEIFLIGFSRGAFTARSIAGLIGCVGILTKAGLPDFPIIFKDFENRANPKYDSPYPDIPFPNKTSASNPIYRDELQRVCDHSRSFSEGTTKNNQAETDPAQYSHQGDSGMGYCWCEACNRSYS